MHGLASSVECLKTIRDLWLCFGQIQDTRPKNCQKLSGWDQIRMILCHFGLKALKAGTLHWPLWVFGIEVQSSPSAPDRVVYTLWQSDWQSDEWLGARIHDGARVRTPNAEMPYAHFFIPPQWNEFGCGLKVLWYRWSWRLMFVAVWWDDVFWRVATLLQIVEDSNGIAPAIGEYRRLGRCWWSFRSEVFTCRFIIW